VHLRLVRGTVDLREILRARTVGQVVAPEIMSWVGVASGAPCAGERMLFEDSIRNPRFRLGPPPTAVVHRHLIAVEVGVEGVADERVNLDRLALDEQRLERLDSEAVSVGARLSSTGCSRITSSRTSQTSGIIESTIFLAA